MEKPGKENQEYKQNARYFGQSNLIQPIGLALVALAIVLFFSHLGYVSYILMSIALPVGIFLAVIGVSHEGEVTAHLHRAVEDVGPTFEEEQALKGRLSHKVGITVAEGFEYREGLPLKKSRGGTIYSSRYSKALLYPLTDAVCIYARSISLVEEDRREIAEEIPYADIDVFAITTAEDTLTCGKRRFTVKHSTLTVKTHSGKCYTMPIADDVTTAALAEFVEKSAAAARA